MSMCIFPIELPISQSERFNMVKLIIHNTNPKIIYTIVIKVIGGISWHISRRCNGMNCVRRRTVYINNFTLLGKSH